MSEKRSSTPWLLIAATVDDGGGEESEPDTRRTGFAPIECAVKSDIRLGISSKIKFTVVNRDSTPEIELFMASYFTDEVVTIKRKKFIQKPASHASGVKSCWISNNKNTVFTYRDAPLLRRPKASSGRGLPSELEDSFFLTATTTPRTIHQTQQREEEGDLCHAPTSWTMISEV